MLYKISRVKDGLTVIDYETGSVKFTKTSYDKDGNYFNFDMGMLESDHTYQISFALYDGSKLKELEDNSIDSIVTDPPYGISFMGQKWDYDVPSVDIWKECYRVLKPGGHLLSFSGSRTYHRMAVNVEDAGFEIRDQIMWVYGSGFPKSLNVGKAIDKRGGNNLLALEISQKLKEARTKRKITLKQADEMFCNGSTNYSWYEGRPKGTRIPEIEDFKKIVDAWPEMQEYYNQTFPADRPVVDVVSKARNIDSSYAIPGLGSSTNYIDIEITEPATEEAKKWDGWGTALKPAHEPIVLARKPFRGDVASNVLEHGTGALNIDGCRVETTDSYSYPNGPKGNSFSVNQEPENKRNEPVESNPLGRWPANFIYDGLDEEWSKYFYCPKANKKDRNEGCEELEEKEALEKDTQIDPQTDPKKKSGIGWGGLIVGGALLILSAGAINYFGKKR
jgi:ubiquinone/menaquinone biosynthesis C-methylase UbiE